MATKDSRLLNLPAELRNQIYELCTIHRPTDSPLPASRSPVALALTCRKVYKEAHALLFAATTFCTRQWTLLKIRKCLDAVRYGYRAHIRRIELTVEMNQFVRLMTRLCFPGLQFAAAGLIGLEVLYLTFFRQYDLGRSETQAISNLESLIWKTVAETGNIHLKKIRVVHNGLFEQHNLTTVCDKLAQGAPYDWDIEFDDVAGRIKMIKNAYDEDENPTPVRTVTVVFGFNIEEAEHYAAVRQDLVRGDILNHLRARLPPNVELWDLNGEATAFQVECLLKAFDVSLDCDLAGIYY